MIHIDKFEEAMKLLDEWRDDCIQRKIEYKQSYNFSKAQLINRYFQDSEGKLLPKELYEKYCKEKSQKRKTGQ
ncbi:MAG: hypothetical protein ACRCUM_04010 [Mycoplasmoidaceae bacterium]